MSGRRLRGDCGATPVDMLLILGCLALLALTLLRVPDLVDYAYRRACHQNQDHLEAALNRILQEERADIFRVAVAYAVRANGPGTRPRMVVLFVPEEGRFWDRVVTRDLPDTLMPRNLSCPVHENAETPPAVIDYAYILGRWRCLHNQTHN